MSLVSLSDLKDYLGIDSGDTSQDTYLNTEIALFDATVKNYCNREFEVSTYTEIIYYDDFRDSYEHNLYHFPIVTLTSVTEKAPDKDDIAHTFRLHKRTGNVILTNDSGSKKRLFSNYYFDYYYGSGSYLEFIYDAGYATVPLEIQESVKALIQARYNRKQAGVDLNFGNNVQRINVPGVMGIDFDYTLNTNERKNKYGMLLGDYLNIFDNYRSERTLIGENSKVYMT